MDQLLGIEMAAVIPGFAARFDILGLVSYFAPRPLSLVLATVDAVSQDAEEIVIRANETCAAMIIKNQLEYKRYKGHHPLTRERFDFIVRWMVTQTS